MNSINVSDFTIPLLIPVMLIPFDRIAVTKLIDPFIIVADMFLEIPFGPHE